MLIVTITFLNCHHVSAIPRSEFYSFGSEAGDTGLALRYYVQSPPIQPQITKFPFFGQDHDTIVINGGGYITFNTSSYFPVSFPSSTNGYGVIVPLWFFGSYGDGQAWYRISSESSLLEQAKRDIRRAFVNQDSFEPLWLLVATWQDVTDHYVRVIYNAEVTYQCVLATDGTRSFAIFYYEDETEPLMTFTETYLQMGYNAGDSINYFEHPQSFSAGLLSIFNTSNVGIPGVWIFRLDSSDAAGVRCSMQSFDLISLVPRAGNMLGGTGVRVTGPCVNVTDSIICTFDKTEVEGVYMDESSVMCVSPNLSKVGALKFALKVIKNDGSQTRTYISRFYSVSPDKGHIVDILSPSLMFTSKGKLVISWPQEKLLSPSLAVNTSTLTVDIHLYYQKYEYSINRSSLLVEWTKIPTPVASSIKNSDGRAEVALPASSLDCDPPLLAGTVDGVCPFALKVSVSSKSPGQRLSSEIGVWTGVAFLQNDNVNSTKLREICDAWGRKENIRGQSGKILLDNVLTCPPTRSLAISDPNFEEESYRSILGSTQYDMQSMSFLHPNIAICYVQVTPFKNAGHQCCYRGDGNLAVGAPGGGSADIMSSKVDFNRHLSDDMIPFVLCCKAQTGTNCEEYYKWRPSEDSEPYVFPIPACIYGDPHIITLDGLKYTFNGKGEFTMIETTDDSFTLQGRMEPTLDQNGNPTPGTVFTALVAREESTNTTTQFELQSGGIDVLVDSTKVEFDETTDSEVIFENVTVADVGNNTVTASFAGGAKMEVTVENDIISIMLITLPDDFKGMTRGLMGSFNKDSSDDLVPKSQTKPISVNSSIEEIHKQFGITWIIDDADESLFTYNSGESWATFYDPSFSPVYQPTFENSTLETIAKEVCGEDESCLFDIAATKKVEIGMATMQGVESFNAMVEMAAPIVCDPPCVNGACVKNDTCSCGDGFEGDQCTIPVISECDVNMCQNNGTCMKHVLTYTCDCPQGFTGAFCQEKEPPFSVHLLNSSPRVNGGVLLIDFETTMSIISAKCYLTGQRPRDCDTGHIRYTGLSVGSYVFRVLATSRLGEKALVRRIVHVGESGDEDFCAVHLINEGVVVDGRSAALFFKGTKAVDSYLCRLRGNGRDTSFTFCRSPTRYESLEVGDYRFQVLPVGCEKGKRLSVRFDIF